jgi:hypothetical protein
MSDVEIAARVVPTSLRWPDNPSSAWDKLRASVESLVELYNDVRTH